jgi:chromosome segregation ATPase
MAVIDELERRVRTVEEEANGEKHLTRYAVEQTQRNGDVLHALRTDVSAATLRLDHLTGDMAAVKAALAMHGRALDVLQQDVRQLRSEVSEINRKLEAIDGDVRQLRGEVSEINRKLDAIIARLG